MRARTWRGETALHGAGSVGSVACVDLLLAAGVDVAAADAMGRTALLVAAFGGHLACVARLIEAGADVAAADKMGATRR